MVVFSGAFAKLRKGTISFVMSVCPSVRPHGTARLSTGRIVMKFDTNIFRKCAEEIQVSTNCGKNRRTRTQHEDQQTVDFICLPHFFLK
jgi:hypothetical protein